MIRIRLKLVLAISYAPEYKGVSRLSKVFHYGVSRMPTAANRFETALDLIDTNLMINRDEVLRYIEENRETVRHELITNGEAHIPTSAGMIVIDKSYL